VFGKCVMGLSTTGENQVEYIEYRDCKRGALIIDRHGLHCL
jgi:hypothetical protein